MEWEEMLSEYGRALFGKKAMRRWKRPLLPPLPNTEGWEEYQMSLVWRDKILSEDKKEIAVAFDDAPKEPSKEPDERWRPAQMFCPWCGWRGLWQTEDFDVLCPACGQYGAIFQHEEQRPDVVQAIRRVEGLEEGVWIG